MMNAIELFFQILRDAGARLSAAKTYITTRDIPDEVEQEYFSALSEPRRTPPEKWIPGRKVVVITTNTPPGGPIPAVRKRRSLQPAKKAPESLREKWDRLLREVKRLEGKHEKK